MTQTAVPEDSLPFTPNRLGTSRTRFASVIFAALLLAILLAWLPGRMVLNQVQMLESQSLDKDATRVTDGLQHEIEVLDALAADWSMWDDAYRFAQDHNAAFIQANLGWNSLLSSSQIQLVSFLDAQGHMFWGGFRLQFEGPSLPMPPSLAGAAPPPPHNGFVLTPQGPLMVVSRPILRSDGSGPSRGTLIMGRLLQEKELARLAHRLGLTFAAEQVARTPENQSESALFRSPRPGGYRVAYTPETALIQIFQPALAGPGGLLVSVPWPRDIYRQGRRAAMGISLMTFLALGALELAFFLGFHRYRRTRHRIQQELEQLVDFRTAELREANRALEEASMLDGLTGLKNRRFVDFFLPPEIARTLRIQRGKQQTPMDPSGVGEDIVFLVIDIDHFRMVNETHGHAAGDAVLREVGSLLRRTCRESDLVARWGGEEFLVIAKRTHRAYASVIADKLLEAFRQHTFTLPKGGMLNKTCSIGYCPFPVIPESPQVVAWAQAVEMADLCLYAVKQSGRDGWVGVTIPEDPDLALLEHRLPGGFLGLVQEGTLTVQSSFAGKRSLQWF